MEKIELQLRKWFYFSFIYFVVVAFAGVLLRSYFVSPPQWPEFKNLLHAHSHLGMLGWVYLALFTYSVSTYIPGKFSTLKYKILYWGTHVTVAGMMVTFPLAGYWAGSIIFSTLHIFLSYWFIIVFLKDAPKGQGGLLFVKGGLFFLFLSSFGPWGLAVLSAKGMRASDLYQQSIYFYLHFLYNGWFTFALIGFLVNFLKERISFKQEKKWFLILFISAIPAYFLSLLNFNIGTVLFAVAVVTAVVQIFPSYQIVRAGISALPESLDGRNRLLFYFFLGMFFLKVLLQLVSTFPGIQEHVFVNRDLIVGYIHLVMLGFISCGIFYFFALKGVVNLKERVTAAGLMIFIAGFLLSEILLFFQGAGIIDAAYNLNLVFSMVMLLGLLILGAGVLSVRREKVNDQV